MCGVFGIHAPDRDVARLAYFGLLALQHRGQESAGIAVSDEGRLTVLRDLGLVTQVFDEQKLRGLRGQTRDRPHALLDDRLDALVERAAARPPRAGADGRARPQRQPHEHGELRAELAERGVKLGSTSDTEVIAALIASDEAPLEEAVANTMRAARGRVLGRRALGGDAARLPRPARLPPALPRPDRRRLGRRLGDLRARPRRRRRSCARWRPGELVAIDDDGCRATQAMPIAGAGALCIFEFFYLARPDSQLDGVEVHGARVRMGERLAREAPVEADLVLPIPDSGTPAAIGFARASGIPFSEGLIKNRYVGRTFIQPDQEHAPAGHPDEVQPARRGRRQADRRRRRLDRARQHDARRSS